MGPLGRFGMAIAAVIVQRSIVKDLRSTINDEHQRSTINGLRSVAYQDYDKRGAGTNLSGEAGRGWGGGAERLHAVGLGLRF